jgi:hypothetical protein
MSPRGSLAIPVSRCWTRFRPLFGLGLLAVACTGTAEAAGYDFPAAALGDHSAVLARRDSQGLWLDQCRWRSQVQAVCHAVPGCTLVPA